MGRSKLIHGPSLLYYIQVLDAGDGTEIGYVGVLKSERGGYRTTRDLDQRLKVTVDTGKITATNIRTIVSVLFRPRADSDASFRSRTVRHRDCMGSWVVSKVL